MVISASSAGRLRFVPFDVEGMDSAGASSSSFSEGGGGGGFLRISGFEGREIAGSEGSIVL